MATSWPKVALTGLLVTSGLAMFRMAQLNGLFDHGHIFSAPGAVLAGTRIPVQQFQTGIKQLDDYFSFMINLFWVDLNPENVRPHIQGLHFYSTLASSWMLMIVEAHRSGSTTSFMILTYINEYIGELFGLGLFTPIWCLYHLSYSATLRQDRSRTSEQKLLIKPADSFFLPLAILLGFGIPTAGMFGCSPAGKGFQSQQLWILLRLLHPIFVLIIWSFLRLFAGSGKQPNTPQTRLAATSTLRHFYTWSMLFSAAGHLLSLHPVMLKFMNPSWLTTHVHQSLNLRELFLPQAFWHFGAHKPLSFDDAVMRFLQWDEAHTAAAILIWAAGVYAQSRPAGLKTSTWTKVKMVVQVLSLTAVAGPGAAAAFLIMERDNAVFSFTESEVKKLQ